MDTHTSIMNMINNLTSLDFKGGRTLWINTIQRESDAEIIPSCLHNIYNIHAKQDLIKWINKNPEDTLHSFKWVN